MDGSSLIFIVMPIVIPLVLFTGIALPYIADSRTRRAPNPTLAPPTTTRSSLRPARRDSSPTARPACRPS